MSLTVKRNAVKKIPTPNPHDEHEKTPREILASDDVVRIGFYELFRCRVQEDLN